MENLVVQTQTRRDTGRVTSVKIMKKSGEKYSISINEDMSEEQVTDVINSTINSLRSGKLDDIKANCSLLQLVLEVSRILEDDKKKVIADILLKRETLSDMKTILKEYKTKDLSKTYFELVLITLTSISNNSIEICKTIWSDTEFKKVLEELLIDGSIPISAKDSCLAVIHNCLRRKEIADKSFSSEQLKTYMNNMLQDTEITMNTKLTVAIIFSVVLKDDDLSILDQCEKIVETLMTYLEKQWDSNIRSYEGYHIDETLYGLIGICRSDQIKLFVVSNPNYVELLKDIATSNNRYEEVQLTLECFQTLAQLDKAKQKLQEEYGMSGYFQQLIKTCTFTDLHSMIRSFMYVYA